MGTHWVSGRWTNPSQVGDADGWRAAAWDDNAAGTTAAIAAAVATGADVFLGGDLNTPAAHMPTLHPAQQMLHNTAGFDKLVFVPGQGSRYEVTFGKVASVDTPSDHNLFVVPVTLTLDGAEVVTFRFGTCNVQHSLSVEKQRATMQAARARCDVVVWQETDTDAANRLIDDVFPAADYYHLFPASECDLTVSKRLFALTTSSRVQISKGRVHVSPHREIVTGAFVPHA